MMWGGRGGLAGRGLYGGIAAVHGTLHIEALETIDVIDIIDLIVGLRGRVFVCWGVWMLKETQAFGGLRLFFIKLGLLVGLGD